MDKSGSFTPGKWTVTKWSSHKHLHISSDDKEAEYGSLMFIADCGNYDKNELGPYNPDVEANARLISAAPDLYEVALIALSLVNTKLFFHPDDKLAQWEKEVIEKAIAKVEGKDEKA